MTKILIHEDTSELDHELTPQTTKSRYNWGDFYMHTLQTSERGCQEVLILRFILLSGIGTPLPCVLEKNRVKYCLSKTINNHGYNEGLHEMPVTFFHYKFFEPQWFFWQNRGVPIFFLWVHIFRLGIRGELLRIFHIKLIWSIDKAHFLLLFP